uniref:Uncharacterized protein n=1 Tax=Hyaloperonospora arabidopsidis (strain Emoy2) TaxID=559515 RepID=M4BUM6_HYAAE
MELFSCCGRLDLSREHSMRKKDILREYHTGSSQHPSAESEIDPDDSIGIQGISLRPSGAAHLRSGWEDQDWTTIGSCTR